MGRFISAVIGLAAENGSPIPLTQTLITPRYGLRKEIIFPLGEICPPVISGSPNSKSRSRTGGSCDRYGSGAEDCSGLEVATTGGGDSGAFVGWTDGDDEAQAAAASAQMRTKILFMDSPGSTPLGCQYAAT